MGNFDKLDTVVDALSAKVDTVTATLAGLAQEVVDLKSKVANPTFDSTADVNRLAGKAQAILDKLAVAEAAAEPELPVQAAAPAAQPVAVDTPAVATETPAA